MEEPLEDRILRARLLILELSLPELSSLALFGTSAAGMAGYALLRIRAARRQDKTAD